MLTKEYLIIYLDSFLIKSAEKEFIVLKKSDENLESNDNRHFTGIMTY